MFQEGNVNERMMMSKRYLPCILEDKYLEDEGMVPSFGQPDKISLECQEDIDWDDIEMMDTYNLLKANKSTGIKRSHVIAFDTLAEDENMNMYDDIPPISSSVIDLDYSKPVLLFQNKYVDSLLNIWRESSEIADESAESTQVNLSQDESEGFSLSSEGFNSGSMSGDVSESEFDDQMFQEFTTGTENVVNSHGQVEVNSQSQADMVRSSSPFASVESNIESDTGINIVESYYNASSPTLDLGRNDATDYQRNFYMNLRSISPELIRSPSPLSSRSSSPRFLRSPSPLEFLQQSFAALPVNSSQDIIFYDDRYMLRTNSPVTVTSFDHEVPNVELDYNSIVEQSDDFSAFHQYRRSRMFGSVDDQIVPEMPEE